MSNIIICRPKIQLKQFCQKCKKGLTKCICSNVLVIQKFWRTISWKSKKFLQPCGLDEIKCLDLDYLKKQINQEYLTNFRIKYYNSTSTKNYKLEDGVMEYLIKESTDGKRIGDGHEPLDVVNDKMGVGIDVACLCLNGNWSNEKSMMQNFKDCGKHLDMLFKAKKYEEAIKLYQKYFFLKLYNAKNKYKVSDIYYLIFISIKNQVYLLGFKLIIENIFNIRMINNSDTNIIVNNVIDPSLGKACLYKSKKRFEIRFSKGVINNFNCVQIY